MTGHPPEIPDKLYFRIGEVSRITKLPASVLRFWESEFPRIKPKRTDAGQRLYRKSDVELILCIRRLLYEKKFTIQGARQHLKSVTAADAPSSIPSVAAPAPDKRLIEELVAELKAIRALLE